MNCEQVEESISGFADGGLSGILRQAISHHVKRCEACSMVLEQERLLMTQLAHAPIPEPNEEFFAKAMVRAREYHEGPGLSESSLRTLPAAACFLLGVFLTVLVQNTGMHREDDLEEQPGGAAVELAVIDDEQLNIHLQVSVKDDIHDAMMVIEVPASLQIVGFEDVNVLEWPVVLKKGKNVLELPVRARQRFAQDQISHLVAKLKTGDQQKNFDIKVTIKSSENLGQDALLLSPENLQYRNSISCTSSYQIRNTHEIA